VRPRSAKAVVKEISAMERGERKVAAMHPPPVSSASLAVEAIEEEAPELLPIAEPYDPPRDTSPTRWWPWFACAVGLLLVLILIITMIAVSAGSRPGVVTVAIDPRNVEILVDGRAVPRELIVNKDIVRLEVAPGKHEMKVTKEGFEPYTVQFSVDSGDIEELRVHLEPKRESRPH
jgi:hypothetical protein